MLRGEIWWASLPDPEGSSPGYRRPVLIVQANAFNKSLINTVVVAALMSNLTLAMAPGNVLAKARRSGLPKDSVINVSQLLTLDKQFLTQRIKMLDAQTLQEVNRGLQLVLGF
jgi:mRNA interferase MazF